MRRLAGNWDIQVTEELFREIAGRFGKDNVKVVEKCIENLEKMN